MKSTSVGISRNAGPCRPVIAARKAIEMYSGMRFVSCTHFANFVIGFSISVWSMSCSAPISKRESGLRPPMISIGLLLCQALAIAVMQSVTPGPAVTTPTPQRRVARDQPSAACPATCSCRMSITFTFSSRHDVVDRLHVPAAEGEDRVDAFLLDRADDQVAAVYQGHGGLLWVSCQLSVVGCQLGIANTMRFARGATSQNGWTVNGSPNG